MSKYTTGEVAAICGVTVRTVQYYDTRGLLSPSEISEGGRRLYSEDDLSRMRVICFLREVGLPIGSIEELLVSDNAGNVIELIIGEREAALTAELEKKEGELSKLQELRRIVRRSETVSLESISDMAVMMKSKKRLRKIRTVLLLMGLFINVIELAGVLLWIKTGVWWPFATGMGIVIICAVLISMYYFRSVSYICPECHKVFHPSAKEAFFANHTPTTRKLTCPHCNYRGFCIETAREMEK